MKTTTAWTVNPKLDLVLERDIDVPVEKVWAAWTEPERLKKWFTPAPWKTVDAELDLRPGGIFRTTFRSPEGEDHLNLGCFLEVEHQRRLVFTDTLLPGYRPAEKPFFTAVVLMEPRGTGTHYTAIAIHGNEETRKKHEEMGFHQGWGAALDQLVAMVKAG